jgi:transposase
VNTVVQFEPYLDKREIAEHYGCSVRTVNEWLRRGAPSAMIAGRRKFRLGKLDPWLRRAGVIEEDE